VRARRAPPRSIAATRLAKAAGLGIETLASYLAAMTDPKSIHHWRRLDDRITTSGQPSEAELADIAALGVRYVINLGLISHEKALPDEAQTVAALGMNYIHIPVDFNNPAEPDFAIFCASLEKTGDAPTHVHCIANYRVSAFFYRYRVTVIGMDETRARADLQAIWHPNAIWAAFLNLR
jgi:uncharacterized protein (TIGR01244 family)